MSAKRNVLRTILWTALILLLIFFSPVGTIVRMLLERKPETVARGGIPVVQAISDYQCDLGLLPLTLDDLVPTYLPAKPKKWWWTFGNASLQRQADQPHTYVGYWFSGDDSGEWRAIGEYARGKLNLPKPVPKQSKPPGEALFVLRLAENERRIERNFTNISFYADKINYLGSEGRQELLPDECKRAIDLFPGWWLPRAVLAAIGESGGDAEAQFRDWANAQGTFNNFWYLSRVYRDKNKAAAALELLDLASDQQVVKEPTDSMWTGADCLFDACDFAYRCGHYELVLKLAHLWELKGTTYGDRSWRAFRAAAELKLGQFEAATDHATRIAKSNRQLSVKADNLEDLLQAAQTHNTNFVYSAGEIEPRWILFAEPRP